MDIGALTIPGTNRPGIGGTIYVTELAWITTFGTAPTNTLPGDELRITGDHVWDTNMGVVAWETEDDVANLKIPVTGSRASLGLKPELTVFQPGLTPANAWHAFQNKSYIGFVKAFGCASTQWLQLGDACNPLRMIPNDGWSSGVSGGNDPRGWMYKLSSNYSVYFYEGDLTFYGA